MKASKNEIKECLRNVIVRIINEKLHSNNKNIIKNK